MKETKPYCCGCIRSKRGLYTCWAVSLLLVIGLGLAVFFLFPRSPSVWIGPPSSGSMIQGLKVLTNASNPALGAINASPEQPFIVQLDLNAEATVYSPNYINVAANSIETNVLF